MSKKIKKKVPKLRFPEFKGDWESKYLDQVGDFKNGFNADKQAFGTGVEFVNLMDIFGKSEIRRTYLDRVEIPEKQLEPYKIQKGDVLFVRSSVKREGVGQSCLVNDYFEDTVYSGFIIRFREKSNTLYHLYKKYCFTESSFRKEILSFATSSANTNINQDSLSQISLFYPSIAEQEKIASFLGAIDTRLTQLRRKHKLLQTYKRGVMQKIFSQEVRFKGAIGVAFPDWEERKLGNIVAGSFSNGVFNDPNKLGQGYRLVNVKDMYNGDFIDVNSLTRLLLDEQEFKKNKAEHGDIFFTRSSLVKEGIAYSNILLSDDQDITYDGHLIRFRFNHKYYLPQFMALAVKTSMARKQFVSRGKTGTMTTIGQDDISTVKISIPSKEEQEKIADFLTAIDQKIEAVARQIDRTEQFKKGLLQKMFV